MLSTLRIPGRQSNIRGYLGQVRYALRLDLCHDCRRLLLPCPHAYERPPCSGPKVRFPRHVYRSQCLTIIQPFDDQVPCRRCHGQLPHSVSGLCHSNILLSCRTRPSLCQRHHARSQPSYKRSDPSRPGLPYHVHHMLIDHLCIDCRHSPADLRHGFGQLAIKE